MKRLIAIAVALAATSALAQATGSAANPDAGFFRPSDLVPPPVPVIMADPGAPQNAQPQTAAADPLDEMLKAEEIRALEARAESRLEGEMDRIERENERAREYLPGPIPGAFTGLTSERDR
jgi:hypothetical protein